MKAGKIGVTFVGPDPLPVLAAGLKAICAEDCGLAREEGPGWARFQVPAPASTAALLADASVQVDLRERSDAIVVWKNSAQVERLAQEVGVIVANSPALIARRIENKSYFSRSAPAAGLPIPPTRAGVAGADLLTAAGELRLPVIFQLARGFSGEHTYLAETPDQLAHLLQRFAGRTCRIAERVLGVPVTVTGVVTEGNLLFGPASLQLTGIESLTPHSLGSCGNDYGQPVPQASAVQALARQAGHWLQGVGHRGVFGLDLVVGAEGTIWCIEINPRPVASLPLFSLTARDGGSPGLLDQHLASFGIGELSSQTLECRWSQLILYQRGRRRSHPALASARGTLTPDGHFRPTGKMGLSGPFPGEAGLVVQSESRPGRELARLLFEGTCCAPDGTLLPHLGAAVVDIRSQLEEPGWETNVS
ncbi:MAG: ATP-grasp domain-containing protein [Candidatus Dormiibacterota bacterium]